MKPFTSPHEATAYVLLGLTLFCPRAKADDHKDIEHQLQAIYENKLMSLRSPHFGRSLLFNSSGSLLNHADAGPWSTCGLLQVKKAKVTADGIQFEAKRVILILRPEGPEYSTTKPTILQAAPATTDDDVRIQIQVAPLDTEHLNDALSHAFDKGSLQERVEAYWKPERLDVDISGPHAPTIVGVLEGSRPVYSGYLGVQAPKVISTQDPSYTEAARRSGLQGVAVLQAIVNENGFPEMLEIVRGLGQGLDLQAILAVSHWKFKPATRDGKPLAVVINVEVTFKLR